jgi:two-component system, LytTR family, response regulator
VIKVLIIDDETSAASLLKWKLERNFKDEFLFETALSAEEARFKIPRYELDLIFLDIEMPIMSGFDLLKATAHINFKVIFTTAYNRYASQAFRYSALDYLLKPIDTNELIEAITKFKRQHKETNWAEKLQRINLLLQQ